MIIENLELKGLLLINSGVLLRTLLKIHWRNSLGGHLSTVSLFDLLISFTQVSGFVLSRTLMICSHIIDSKLRDQTTID